ncbi:FAD-dependent oxidoreductase [Parabacteroides sp. AM08-6]|uniref:FAD-dependent oxidoreductase n=1 Tax=Parabacteroides sp. AM08-6 TaxID=2292053 RepID=UPI000F00D97E|nr:FAD-dependent oxidoreductase [Parabacteroides sp. AM08-6]RHJ81484.1 FAD-dependent oxidoreductase [Parabacteroides sp. AM08-6]
MVTRRDFFKITAASGALASLGSVSEAKTVMQTVVPNENFCHENPRKIPVIAEVDIVVAGGSARAIAAAVAAARAGSRVYLIGYMPYPGEDICGSHLYEREADEKPQTALAYKLFPGENYPTPLHVKKTLEDELIDNNIQFLYSSYVTNALIDSTGKPAGVVIANRSGRQAIRCKAIIDATTNASVAMLFGTEHTPFTPGMQEFNYTVVGNSPKEAKEIVHIKEFLQPIKVGEKSYPVTRYTFQLPIKDNSYASLAEAEQIIRNLTWDIEQVDSSDLLWYIPRQTIISEHAYHGEPTSIRQLPMQAFKSKNISNIWVLGPCAEIPRKVAAKLMRPVPSLFIGEILGEYIAKQTNDLSIPSEVSVRQPQVNASNYGEIKELLSSLRPNLQKGFVDSPSGALPVLGSYDVVVMGGGTAGASAGISAAKQGANTLVLEYLHGLGGLSTLGMIGVYWDGFRGGYTSHIDKSVLEMAPKDHPRQPKGEGHFPADWKMEWLRKELLSSGGKLWFGVLGCGALTDGNQVKGVIVATPYGRGVILSKVLIDSTGSADIAIAAGASFDYTGKKTLAVQGAGTGKWAPGDYYNNNDWLFVDDTDILDVSRAFIQAKTKLQGQYDLVKIPQTRERRRIIGDYIITVYDVINHRRYSDTISYHKSSFDTHGMIIDPFFILNPPEQRHTIYDADVPLRCLLPKGLEGILTTGLGASAHRDAMPVIRMQPCLQNQGYAVGYLSALCIKENKSLRKIDIKKVQRHLVKIGNLPERVLTDKEFKGFSNSEMKKALASVTDNYKGLEILLTDREHCLQLLSKQISQTSIPEEKIILASILCILGDKKQTSILADAIRRQTKWDKGWHYTGMGQFGMSLSRLDALITALGNARDISTLPVILDKAKMLEPEDYFSHFRAIAMATEAIGNKEAIPTLTAMLTTPGVRFHSISSYAEARSKAVPDLDDTSTRNLALKELHLARALYLCGDQDGIGEEVLCRYANGLQGHYARYAIEILNSK